MLTEAMSAAAKVVLGVMVVMWEMSYKIVVMLLVELVSVVVLVMVVSRQEVTQRHLAEVWPAV